MIDFIKLVWMSLDASLLNTRYVGGPTVSTGACGRANGVPARAAAPSVQHTEYQTVVGRRFNGSRDTD